MKNVVHKAFWRTWGAKAWSFATFVALSSPNLMPNEMKEWVASIIPWAPSWLHILIGLSIPLIRVTLAWTNSLGNSAGSVSGDVSGREG